MELEYISFFTTERLNTFWQNVIVIFAVAAPLVVIVMGTDLAGKLIETLREVFHRSISSNDDDDENYD